MLELTIAVVKGFLSALFVRYPGATIRYVVSGKKGFEEYLEDDMEYNVLSVLSALAFFIMIINLYRIVLFY